MEVNRPASVIPAAPFSSKDQPILSSFAGDSLTFTVVVEADGVPKEELLVRA